MTILSKNLIRLREYHNYTKEFIARYVGASQPAVSQWESDASAYIPKIDKLIRLASLYKTTVEELVTNPKLVPGEIVNPMLDQKNLEKVFRTLDKSELLSYAFKNARVKRRAYFFTLLYSLCEEIESNYLDETEVTALMDIPNEAKKTSTSAGSGKPNPARTTRKKKGTGEHK